jgi:hypothetical protein
VHPRHWADLSIKDRWSLLAEKSTHQRKALASLSLLIVWKIWNERDARVFRNKSSPAFVIVEKIKGEARLWVIAGAKCLDELLPKEKNIYNKQLE